MGVLQGPAYDLAGQSSYQHYNVHAVCCCKKVCPVGTQNAWLINSPIGQGFCFSIPFFGIFKPFQGLAAPPAVVPGQQARSQTQSFCSLPKLLCGTFKPFQSSAAPSPASSQPDSLSVGFLAPSNPSKPSQRPQQSCQPSKQLQSSHRASPASSQPDTLFVGSQRLHGSGRASPASSQPDSPFVGVFGFVGTEDSFKVSSP